MKKETVKVIFLLVNPVWGPPIVHMSHWYFDSCHCWVRSCVSAHLPHMSILLIFTLSSTLTCIIKYARANSYVKWLKGEKTSVSRTTSVLIHRILMCFTCHISTLRTRTKMVFETLFYSPFNHLTWLVILRIFHWTVLLWKLQIIHHKFFNMSYI
jgi:hypothetical protein